MASKTLAFEHGLTSEARQRLAAHFSGDGPPVNDRWSALWDAGDFLPWDRGIPNPALIDTMNDCQSLLGESIFVEDPQTGERRRKRALVPGCGRGYDVLLFSSLGYDAWGLEVSVEAVKQAEDWAEQHIGDYAIRNPDVGRGNVAFIVGDFYTDTWLSQTGASKFEILYDYTFLCAMPPALRPSWALRYKQLLSTHLESCLICVEFPTYKELSTGGPPWGVPSIVYLAHLNNPGREIPYDQDGNPIPLEEETSVKREESFERVAHWKPLRTHAVGEGTDWVSVWKIARVQ